MTTQPIDPSLDPSDKVHRADQDRVVANSITLSDQQLDVAQHDPEVAGRLTLRGYAPTKIAEGTALQHAAQLKFNARQIAMSLQDQAGEKRDAALALTLKTYVDFRGIARSIFPVASDQAALGLSGEISRDTQQVITDMRASYAAALLEPHAAILATYGYDAAAIAAAIATVDDFEAAATAFTAAIAEAGKARADRDAAYDDLEKWMKQLRGVARVALGDRPDLKKKMQL